MSESRRRDNREFRAEVAQIVTETVKPVAQVSRVLDTCPGTWANWSEAARRRDTGGAFGGDGRGELMRLCTENAELHLKRDVLKGSVVLLVNGALRK